MTPSAIHPDRVAVYIRWSTDDQGEGTTLEVQRERCIQYVLSQGWRFHERLLFVDDGCSGGSLDRPALSRLRAAVATGEVECVVVYKIDRLSRSVADIVDLVLREWEGRCFVKSTTEEVNTLTPSGKMFFYLLISFAEYERSLIRERTMGGKLKRAEQGLNPGFRPPFGYRTGKARGLIEVVPHEAELVRRIFALHAQGCGPGQIAGLLNGEGLTRRGRPWSGLAIRRMLANPAYAGILQYRGPGRPPTRVEGAFPAIVDRARWEEAQRLLTERSAQSVRAGGPAAGSFLLAGLARCRCGAPLGGKRVGGRRYYYCTARRRYGAAVCAAGHLPADPADAEVAGRARERLAAVAAALAADPEEPGAEAAARAELAAQRRAFCAALREAHAESAALAQRRRRVEADYRSGLLSAHLYEQEAAALSAEEQQIRRRAGSLRRRLAAVQRAAAELGRIEPPGADLWAQLAPPEQKELLRRMTGLIRLFRPAGGQGPIALEIEWIGWDRTHRMKQPGERRNESADVEL